MKFHIKYFENGVFVTDIGGPLDTLADAIAQLEKYSRETNAVWVDSLVGCKWDRGGNVACGLVVIDEWGNAVSEVKAQKE